jgi:hypothetical protein
MHTHQMQW